jgi:hypothetical protein
MITIDRGMNEYKLKFSEPGTGWRSHKVVARDVDEIKEAIDHYYGEAPHALSPQKNCPLCRKLHLVKEA